jgi:hypothetical protein
VLCRAAVFDGWLRLASSIGEQAFWAQANA